MRRYRKSVLCPPSKTILAMHSVIKTYLSNWQPEHFVFSLKIHTIVNLVLPPIWAAMSNILSAPSNTFIHPEFLHTAWSPVNLCPCNFHSLLLCYCVSKVRKEGQTMLVFTSSSKSPFDGTYSHHILADLNLSWFHSVAFPGKIWFFWLLTRLISGLMKAQMNVMVITDHLLAKWECVLHRELVPNWVLLMQVSGCGESVWSCRLFNQRSLSSYSGIIWRAIWMTLWQSAI